MPSTPTTRGRGNGAGASHAETPVLLWIAFEEEGICYGVCLNRYMVATAPSRPELEAAIAEMMDAHIETSGDLGIVPFAHLPQAPAEYWSRWLELTSQRPFKIVAPAPGVQRPPIQLAAA